MITITIYQGLLCASISILMELVLLTSFTDMETEANGSEIQ